LLGYPRSGVRLRTNEPKQPKQPGSGQLGWPAYAPRLGWRPPSPCRRSARRCRTGEPKVLQPTSYLEYGKRLLSEGRLQQPPPKAPKAPRGYHRPPPVSAPSLGVVAAAPPSSIPLRRARRLARLTVSGLRVLRPCLAVAAALQSRRRPRNQLALRRQVVPHLPRRRRRRVRRQLGRGRRHTGVGSLQFQWRVAPEVLPRRHEHPSHLPEQRVAQPCLRRSRLAAEPPRPMHCVAV